MVRDVNLIGYLPQYVADYREIAAIMAAENPEFNFLVEATEQVRNASFILDADEYGVARYEKMLKLQKEATDTLDDRKARILIKWNNDLPYTYKVLILRLMAVCGEDGFEVNTNFEEGYDIEVKIIDKNASVLRQVRELLNDMLPANLLQRAIAQFDIEQTIYFGGGVYTKRIIEISMSGHEEYEINHEMYLGMGIHNKSIINI